MTRLLLGCFMAVFVKPPAQAQQKFTITYLQSRAFLDTVIETGIQYSLVVSDSVSYCYTDLTDYPQKRKQPLGSEFRAHAEYRDLKKNLLVFNSHLSGFGRLLVLDTIRRIQWEMAEGEKHISGFKCKKAIGVENGQQLTAWYSPEFPAGYGPFTPMGLPGTIMEIYYRNYETTVSAVEVKNSAEYIVAPSKGKAVSREKYDKYVKSIYRRPPRIIYQRRY